MIWNCLKLSLWTESPVVVVLSGSMEPSMQRGDILLLHKLTPIKVGDIIVYQLEGENIPIVPLYFAKARPTVIRDGQIIMVDDDRMRLLPGEQPVMRRVSRQRWAWSA